MIANLVIVQIHHARLQAMSLYLNHSGSDNQHPVRKYWHCTTSVVSLLRPAHELLFA